MDLSFIPRNICNRIEMLRNQDCTIGASEEYELPGVKIFATKVESVLQNGPQCGLVVLQMAGTTLGTFKSVEEIDAEAKRRNITRNGEMFSNKWLAELGQNIFPDLNVKNCELPSAEELTSQLMAGNLWLVPYDCDRNHEPAFLNGHKAHWCIIVGFLITSFDCEDIKQIAGSFAPKDLERPLHVLVQHGKSNFMALWSYDQLKKSNGQLHSSGPDRPDTDYVLPPDGIDLTGGCVFVGRK